MNTVAHGRSSLFVLNTTPRDSTEVRSTFQFNATVENFYEAAAIKWGALDQPLGAKVGTENNVEWERAVRWTQHTHLEFDGARKRRKVGF